MYNNNYNRGSYGGNSYRSNSYGNNRGGYSRNNYGNSYGGNGYSGGQNRQAKKRTGCKSGQDTNGNPYVRGWNVSRQYGLVTFLCVPYGKTKQSQSKSGKVWENWMVKVQPKMGKEYIVGGMYDVQTRRVIIKDMGLVLNPKADYCGKFTK